MPIAEQCCGCQHCIALFDMPPGTVFGIQVVSLGPSFRHCPYLSQAKDHLRQGAKLVPDIGVTA